MFSKTTMLTLLAVLALFALPAAAADPRQQVEDELNAAQHSISPTLESYCEATYQAANGNASAVPTPGSGEPAPEETGEFDVLDDGSRCKRMRDDAQRTAYDVVPYPSFPETCHTVRGIKNCVVVDHFRCDVGVVLYNNMIRACIGGLNPDNPEGPY